MAGEEADTVLAHIEKHRKYNVQSMLNYTALETHGYTMYVYQGYIYHPHMREGNVFILCVCVSRKSISFAYAYHV